MSNEAQVGLQTEAERHKQAAVEQWTADPCGPGQTPDDPGPDYFRRLLEGRHAYAPWMESVLAYDQWRGKDVLDVGCGQGIDLGRYATAGAHATGVDLTPRHVELAQGLIASLELEAQVVQGDAESLPFEDQSFDRVSSNGVLHHTPDMPAALREVHRVLRPGGQAVVIVYNRNSLHYWVNQFLYYGILRGYLWKERSMEGVLSRNIEDSSIDARPLVRVYTRKQMRDLMQTAGFREVSTCKRHFRAVDTVPTQVASRFFSPLRNPSTLDRIGRIAGWYVVATATRPG